jgi:hypothetical protein
MKKYFIAIALVTLSTPGFSRVDAVKKCLNRAMVKSMNIKLQNLSQNNSFDEEITFSCNNISSKSRHELISIRKDQVEVMNKTIAALVKNGSVNARSFARLNAELSNKNVSTEEMCPMIESNFESQLRRVADIAFSADLKKCPQTREKFQAEYFNIMSSTDIVSMPMMDACHNLVGKIKQLKEKFQDQCNGNVSEKPKTKKFGIFGKVTVKKAPTPAQILQVKILKAFKAKRSSYLA